MSHTVRTVALIVIITILVLSISTYANIYLARSSQQMVEYIDRAENSVKAGNLSVSRNELRQLQQRWKKTKKIWAILTDHAEIDKIEETLFKLEKLMEVDDQTQALEEISSLRQHISHIPEMVKPSLENIF